MAYEVAPVTNGIKKIQIVGKVIERLLKMKDFCGPRWVANQLFLFSKWRH